MTAIWHHDERGWRLLAPTGFPDEATLHTLVEQAPQILPLAGTPRMTVLGREVLLGNGYADLVAIEASGRLAIIEVKLAKNAEARRAVVAQVLAYAAYLHGTTIETLEQTILGSHLQKRGFSSLAQAVASEDQEGAFDAATFADAVTQNLQEGRFRLVIVLDSAPSELVRLATFLESSTEKLLIDLVTVSQYDVGGSKLLVPQRIEGEPERPAQAPAPVGPRSPQGKLVEGADDFIAAIEQAPEQDRATLKKLAEWAVALEDHGLAHLSTYHWVTGSLSLLPRLLVENVGLVTIYNDHGAYLQFWRKVFERRAPTSIQPVEQLLGNHIGQGTTTRSITEDLLSVLNAAYQQAGNAVSTSQE